MTENGSNEDWRSRAWTPSPEFIATTNMAWLMQQAGAESYDALHRWSVEQREAYWEQTISRLGIRFRTPYRQILDLSDGVEAAHWLPGAKLNIAESCFSAPPDSIAIIHQSEEGALQSMSVGELKALTDRVAANLVRIGLKPDDAVAIFMPMTAESVALYLGIIKAGCVVVGIADSFQPREVATRLRLSQAKAIFTQDVLLRGGKTFPLYAHVEQAEGPLAIVVPAADGMRVDLRAGDLSWDEFLQADGPFEAVLRDPEDLSNILFSSGTTGDPKVIPWNHTTPIKCAADAHFHQNIHPSDVVVWPTSLGWMMGPWLIYAGLVNRATIGLYSGAPTGRGFGQFVAAARTTMLGVVPSLISTWRATKCLEGLDWSSIRAFSSTGECSRPDDMHWLMQVPGDKPVPIVEYCGGTELAGAYIANTLTRPCAPGVFNTPTLGLDLMILDDAGQPAFQGELFIVPPSIGNSTRLLNGDHHSIYFDEVPIGPAGEVLRRHGDEMKRLPDGYWRVLGRADDTMNLGGIKVSSAEIEQTLQSVPGLVETAAIAVAPDDGPSQLVIYAVPRSGEAMSVEAAQAAMQQAIRKDLNPLFKIQSVIFVDALPRTASNKVMRRVLRDQYLKSVAGQL